MYLKCQKKNVMTVLHCTRNAQQLSHRSNKSKQDPTEEKNETRRKTSFKLSIRALFGFLNSSVLFRNNNVENIRHDRENIRNELSLSISFVMLFGSVQHHSVQAAFLWQFVGCIQYQPYMFFCHCVLYSRSMGSPFGFTGYLILRSLMEYPIMDR